MAVDLFLICDTILFIMLEKSKKIKSSDYGISIEEMRKVGVNFGHRISKCHPKMKPYVVGVKGSDHINMIDLEKTKEHFIKTLDFLSGFIKEGKTIIFVGTKVPARKLVKEIAKECKMPYVVNRWLGGTLTNFSIMQKRIKYFKELEEKKKSGELDKYTKKEQLVITREAEKMDNLIGGIKDLEKIPDVLFVVDVKKNSTAIKEAKIKKIPIVAFCDTNINPEIVDYPIPANDDATKSIEMIVSLVAEAVKEGKKLAGKEAPAKKEEKKPGHKKEKKEEVKKEKKK